MNSNSNANSNKFAVFDFDNFPSISIKLNNTIKDENDYKSFTHNWLNAYRMKQYYHMIIDSSNTNLVSMSYVIRISQFIKNLKATAKEKYGEQWLQYSIILVKSDFVMKLLNMIFYISNPIAPVFIISKDNDINLIQNTIQNTIKNTEEYKNNESKINPLYFDVINDKLKKENLNYRFVKP